RRVLFRSDEAADMQRRHAEYFSDLFQRAVDEWLHLPEANWRGRYLPEIDNVRAALEWSLGANGDAQIAVALAGATGPIWPALTLYGEGAQRLRSAAERVHSGTPVAVQARLLFWLASADEEAMPARSLQAFERAVALYEKLGDQTDLAHAMLRLSRLLTMTGRFEALATAMAKALPALEQSGVPRLLVTSFTHAAHPK